VERLIIDTSAWIQFSIDPSDKLSKYVQYSLTDEKVEIYTCLPIIQEYLQGFRNDRDYEDAVLMLTETKIIPSCLKAILEAAQLYRSLRKKGLTIRKPNDCLIAWYAIHYGLTLVHNDRDFDVISEHTALNSWEPA
jgi:hypothetical protein